MKSLIAEIANRERFELTLVLGSSLLQEKYGSPWEYIKRDHPNVDLRYLNFKDEYESTPTGTTQLSGDIGHQFGNILGSEKYDCCVVVADRFETLPAAMAATYHGIPLVHIQGGEVTRNIDDRVRHSVTKLADYHCVSTQLAASYLKEMGEEPKRVWVTGCPSLDLIRQNRIRRNLSSKGKKYILVVFHPQTEYQDEAFTQTEAVLRAVTTFCGEKGIKAKWFWPNNDPGREEIVGLIEKAHKEFPHILEKAINQEPEQFYVDLSKCRFIIGNSSSTLRESSYLGVPSICVGTRQGIRERGINCRDIRDFDHDDLISAMYEQWRIERFNTSRLYGDGRAAPTIANYLERTDFTLKDTLTYPFNYKYYDDHFSHERFSKHVRQRDKRAAYGSR